MEEGIHSCHSRLLTLALKSKFGKAVGDSLLCSPSAGTAQESFVLLQISWVKEDGSRQDPPCPLEKKELSSSPVFIFQEALQRFLHKEPKLLDLICFPGSPVI